MIALSKNAKWTEPSSWQLAFEATRWTAEHVIHPKELRGSAWLAAAPVPAAPDAGFGGLPVDQLQPWETLDGNGNASSTRGASAINDQSEFMPGIDCYLAGGDCSGFSEAHPSTISTVVRVRVIGNPATSIWNSIASSCRLRLKGARARRSQRSSCR